MDEKTRELMSQLKDGLISASDGQIAEIITEAREEALAEAKAIIKEMMVQAILEHTLSGLEGTRSKAVPAESEEQIQQEIEATRRKIAENERLLNQMTADHGPPTTVEPSSCDSGLPSAVGGRSGGSQAADDGGEGSEGGYGYYVYGIAESDSSQPIEGLPEEGIDPAYPVYALQPSAISHQLSAISHQPSAISHQLSAPL